MQLIPKSAAPFFQEYHFDTLDAATNAALIMERLLAYGHRSEIRWLFENYCADEIRGWVERNGERLLSRRRYQLWPMLFDLPEHKIAEKRQAWPY